MPDEPVKKPEKAAPKMVLEADLIAFKKGSTEREKKLREELEESKAKLTQAESETKLAKMNVEDDEVVSTVKAHLVEEDRRIRGERAKLDKDLASLEEREREARVQALASEHQVDIDAIKYADDPEKEALKIKGERLTREKQELEKEKTPESVFESGTPGTVKKSIWDMSDDDFNAHVEKQKREALSKK